MPTALPVSASVDTFMQSPNQAAMQSALGLPSPVGDMTKAVYDPQNLGKISGDNNSGNSGGSLSLDAGAGTGAVAGNINTSGGYGIGAAGGDINTSGGSSPGGVIDTSNGGGSIYTQGTGLIQLGSDGIRTTIEGQATSNININFPDAGGTVLLNNQFSTLLSGSSITPAPDGTYVAPTSITIQNGIITAIS